MELNRKKIRLSTNDINDILAIDSVAKFFPISIKIDNICNFEFV